MSFIEDEFTRLVSKKTDLEIITNPTDSSLYDLIQGLSIKSMDLLIVLEELLINCKEHGAPPIEFYYGKSFGSYFFAFVDYGVGIHESIPLNIKLSDTKGKSSSSIIRLSLEEGITGTGQIGRGMGLFYLSKLVRNKNASCIVASNSGFVMQVGDYFYEKRLPFDIKKNVVLLRVKSQELGI